MSLYLIVHSKYYKWLLKLVLLMEKLILVEHAIAQPNFESGQPNLHTH